MAGSRTCVWTASPSTRRGSKLNSRKPARSQPKSKASAWRRALAMRSTCTSRRHRRNQFEPRGALGSRFELARVVNCARPAKPGRRIGLHRCDDERRRHVIGRFVGTEEQVEDGHRSAIGSADRLFVTNIDLAEAEMGEGAPALKRIRTSLVLTLQLLGR